MKRGSREAGGIICSLLSILGFGVLALAGLAWVGLHFLSQVRVEERDTDRGRMVKVETPLGSVRVNQREGVDPKHLGLPAYPGARRADRDGGAASIELNLGEDRKEFTVAAASYATSDPVDEVREFYRKKLPHCLFTRAGIECSHQGYKRLIVIHRHRGETRIAVLDSQAEPESN
ncbi:MAG: hypothetical protein HYR60_06635 [Acidobacteria bacterium]|nr:hypothetical protein [Acidobacteriota bacterium]MBI3469723.1 hypothetical protein [Candidatus Solibacter usitatus]